MKCIMNCNLTFISIMSGMLMFYSKFSIFEKVYTICHYTLHIHSSNFSCKPSMVLK